ncbi:hypothetical protein EVAR_50206_1 [Eumeta japonica]|uniref:Uncharacterized protein n=1 Tax=Eumeta variegata TaxID=151549 RepID=A0A4C1WY40_EUMVA|nr:hypothetical protein EVAR_50206_1 [Eumeta japonica]
MHAPFVRRSGSRLLVGVGSTSRSLCAGARRFVTPAMKCPNDGVFSHAARRVATAATVRVDFDIHRLVFNVGEIVEDYREAQTK